MTLTTALHLHRGGSPKGPAGTGKTETVKDLGKALGAYVIVVNCSEGLDYKSMGRMYSGLAQVGTLFAGNGRKLTVRIKSIFPELVIGLLNKQVVVCLRNYWSLVIKYFVQPFLHYIFQYNNEEKRRYW